MKVKNERFINQEVVFSSGVVKFDENGVADIKPDELAKQVLELQGFYPVDNKMEKSKTDNKEEAVEQEETKEEEKPLATEDMTHKELDALAQELGVEDYPKNGDKEAKVKAINSK